LPLRCRSTLDPYRRPCSRCGQRLVVETSLGPLGAGCSLVCPPQWYGWRSLEGSGSAGWGEWLEISRPLIPELCVSLCVSNFSGVFPVAIWSNSKGVPKNTWLAGRIFLGMVIMSSTVTYCDWPRSPCLLSINLQYSLISGAGSRHMPQR